MSVRNPGPARLVLTLSFTGLASGLALAGVFMLTQPRIDQNRAEALRAAIFQVLPGTSSVRTFERLDSALAEIPETQKGPEGGPRVYAGLDDGGELVGYAVPAEGAGFQDTISLLYGFDPRRGVIIGLAILENRETPGLGDKIVDDPDFHENFVALEVEPVIVSVRHDKDTKPNEVDCITGATISSEAVVSILNRSVERWREILAGHRVDQGVGAGEDA